ncbi:CRISPR-associated ring nuclease Csm6 [Denitratimonas sp. CY0512]|uniref:CRISPR-associated ring nuclease Csm6 n=1 Tax=Denitratimonas sp. CY0512 TaxID=3131940 RepID=UPI0030A2DAC9
MSPEQFPHRVLIAVSGKSAQILTETLYALIHQEPAFVPTEVHLISTAEGARHASLNLLGDNGWFLRLCRDYQLDPEIFDASRIHVISDSEGQALTDIRSPADNEAAADFITGFIRERTDQPDAALHVSMAGGRKTMGYYAGYALSLYGRDQDRLSHVLVSEGFENHPAFYYPTPTRARIEGRNGFDLDASQARVDLANIPFVRLRDELPEAVRRKSNLLAGRQSFSAAVNAAEAGRKTHRLTLDLQQLVFQLDDQPLEGLGAADLSLLCWMAWRQHQGKDNLRRAELEESGRQLGMEYGRFCEYLQSRDESLMRTAQKQGAAVERKFPELAKSINAMQVGDFSGSGDFEYRRSNLGKRLKAIFGERTASQFIPQNFGPYGKAEYGFANFEDHFTVIAPDQLQADHA